MPENPNNATTAPGSASAIADEQLAEVSQPNEEDFANLIRRGEVSDWNDRRITGEVNLVGVEIDEPLEIRNAVFTGTVNFSQAQFKRGVDFTGCRFEQKLILSDARVEGSLKLDNVVIGIASEQKQKAESSRSSSENEKGQAHLIRRWISQRRWQKQLKEAKDSGVKPPTIAEFDNLRVEGSLSMMKANVFGRLSCNHSEIKSDFRLDGARIRGDLSLRHASLGELLTSAKKLLAVADADDFDEPCRIDGRLDLTSATIAGDLRLIGITIGGQLTLQGIDISGNLLCRSSEQFLNQLKGGVWLLLARIKGVVDFSGSWIHGNVNLSGAKIDNTLFFVGVNLKKGSLSIENGSIGGTILLRALRQEKPLRCKIAGQVWLLGATVAGDIDISGARIGDVLMLQNANIGQNFMAKTMEGFRPQIKGNIHLTGARIRGGVELDGAILRGDIDLDGASIAGDFIAGLDVNDADGWRVVRSEVRGKLHAESATIGKRVVLMGLTVGEANLAEDARKGRGVIFTGAQISGEFSLFSEDVVNEILQSKKSGFPVSEATPDIEERVIAEARRERTVIHGNLRLTRAQMLGGILLDRVTIAGELDMRDANVRANINCRAVKLNPGEPTLRASAYQSDFETLDMTGDMNLTGLDIGWRQAGRGYGDLILRDAKVRGRLELSTPEDLPDQIDGEQSEEQITIIPGKLHLDAAEISHVVISGRNFGDEPPAQTSTVWDKVVDRWRRFDSLLLLLYEGGREEAKKEVRFGLERATIGRLEIKEPLPGTLDLSNLKVDRWDLPADRSSYKKMLESSYPFKKSNYLAIESVLRNAGDDEKADEAHVCMRRRDRRSTKSRWKILLDLFLDLSIKYGTTSKRIVCAMLVLFALSVWIFSDRNHVEYEIDATADAPRSGRPPEAADWGLGDAVLFAARLNVPIISLGVEEKVKPRGTNLKAYAMGVVAANWVMWPLLIASASGFIRKRN